MRRFAHPPPLAIRACGHGRPTSHATTSKCAGNAVAPARAALRQSEAVDGIGVVTIRPKSADTEARALSGSNVSSAIGGRTALRLFADRMFFVVF